MIGRALRAVAAALLVAIVAAAPAAAADPPDPGRIERFTYGSGIGAYSYVVYTPTSYDRTRPAPLLVMTHGCQTTADQQMRANGYNRLAERERFVVLYPDVDYGATIQPGPLVRCWRFFWPGSWHRDGGDAAAIAGMTREVAGRWRIDPERIYLMGMSAGGFMTSILSATYPDLYAAVGIMAGGAYADPLCLLGSPVTTPVADSAQAAFAEMGPRARVVPRLVVGGDADRGITPPCQEKALEQGLRTNNLVIGGRQEGPIPLTPAAVREQPPERPGGYPSTVRTYRDPNGCVIGERWIVHGMDHFWSGGSSDPRLAGFTDPKGPSGVEISWRFFRRYTRASTAMPCAEAPAPAPPPAVPATPAPSTGPPRCARRTVAIRLPARTATARASFRGRRVPARIVRGRLRVRLPATRRSRTVVVVRARTSSGRRTVARHVYRGCGPRTDR
ncbi:extracellular catalytic domain type 1 short-chain-length polyhydroxyalkanoate depolymerase [Patulibacter defluvii]|uniref:extracellular catalytic domain type 1 short-chain-length polyhydroxyalkanoate depolymerase n=1 Tax=Patulibacter defluvii TaxID=3095358 RepID=UPI002A74FB97|nr:PHB depolymerase family esterase [Patulibacter sp. DM4]